MIPPATKAIAARRAKARTGETIGGGGGGGSRLKKLKSSWVTRPHQDRDYQLADRVSTATICLTG